MSKSIITQFIGKAGEYAVASQLLLRKVVVHFPAVDDGVDLIAGEHIRIQVKTRRRESCRQAGYNFTLGQKRISCGVHKDAFLRAKNMAEIFPKIDYLICWGVEDNKFWVLPSEVLSRFPAVQSLGLGTPHRRYADYDEILRLYTEGHRQCHIAERLDIHPVTVSEICRGRVPKINPAHMLAIEADKYENNWDGLISSIRLAEEVDKPLGVEEFQL